MAKFKIAGLDGSLRNFGCAIMTFDTDTMAFMVDDLLLVQTAKTKNKQIRASSDTFMCAQQIKDAVHPALKDCVSAFVEVPYGGQSYAAVLGFGIVVGLYASLPIPTNEVSPSETKMAAVGTKTASKEEMIEWAVEKFPDAPWRRYKQNGKNFKKGDLMKDNEHLADAVAIAFAGIATPSFRNTLQFLKSMAA